MDFVRMMVAVGVEVVALASAVHAGRHAVAAVIREYVMIPALVLVNLVPERRATKLT